MKKFLFIALAFFFISSASFGQSYVNNDRLPNIITKAKVNSVTNSSKTVYMSEDFEGVALPTGWTETHGAATTGWEFGNNLGSTYWVIPSHTNYAATNDDVCNCDMSNVLLYTATIDLSNAGNPNLNFQYILSGDYSDMAKILVSTNNGTSWDTLTNLPSNTAWSNKDVSLIAYANDSNVTIGFFYSDGGDWGAGVAIDDIIVEDGPTTADLVSASKGFISEYYSQPLDQVIPFIPEGNVYNNGFALSTPTNFILTAGAYSDTNAITIPLANGADENFTFASYTPTQGNVSFVYNADFASDDDSTDNIYTKDIYFGGTELRRDNGISSGAIGIGSPGGEMGNIFTIAADDTLTSVKFQSSGANGDQVIAIVRAYGSNGPTTDLGQSLPITTLGTDTTIYEANFAVPVALPAGTYFIGLIEGANNLQMSYTSTPYVQSSAWAFFSNSWHDLGVLGYKHTYYLRPQFDNVVPVDDDVAMISVDIDPVITAGNVDVIGTVRNMSNHKNLTSFDVSYTIDGGAASATYNVTGVNIAPGATYNFTHNVQWAATAGVKTVEVTVSNPNGIADEDPSDNVMSKQVLVASELYDRNVVYEEGTGTWCGWCVRGLVGLNTMAHNVTDGTWIGIGVHNNDPMVVTEYDNAIGNFIGGYPSGIMNRMPDEIDPGLSTLQSAYNTQKAIPALAKIEIVNPTYDATNRNWSLDVKTTFGIDMSNANYNTALIIVENNVTGTSSGYNQANYYSGGANGNMIDYDGTNYANLSNPVPASDMVYNHVGRVLVDGFNGSANSIPTSITYNTPNTFSYSGTLSANIVDSEASFVALIIDNANGEIVNATEYSIGTVGIDNPAETAYNIYPNPTTGKVVIEGAENSQITVYNMIGEIVYSEDNVSNLTTIDLSKYNSGNYMVRVVNNNDVTYHKIILTK